MFETFTSLLGAPFIQFLPPGEQFSLWSLAGALLTAAIVYLMRRPGRIRLRARALIRGFFPARIWRHPSSLLDYRFFFVSSWFYASGILGLFGFSEIAKRFTHAALDLTIGQRSTATGPEPLLTIAMPVLYVLVYDLAYWAAHYLMHRLPVLWEFHKVHHSAEVMTPFTEWRQHPVELLMFPLFAGSAIGILYATVDHVFGPRSQGFSLLNVNILLYVYMLSFLHLRHSHLWIAARGWLGHIVQSPAQHQIHHSTEPRHHDRNLGLSLSVWDWAFGTLYVPETRERLVFGIGAEGKTHDGIWRTFWQPFAKAAVILAGPAEEKPGADGTMTGLAESQPSGKS